MTRIRSFSFEFIPFLIAGLLVAVVPSRSFAGPAVAQGLVFSFAPEALKTPSRTPASLARFKSPELTKLERPPFLPGREVAYFDGKSGFVHPGPLATVGPDERGSFTVETVVYPSRLNGRRTLLSNIRGRTGFSLGIVDGRLVGMVFLRARGAPAAAPYILEARGPKTHVWQQIVFAGFEQGNDFEVRMFIDGRELAHGRCIACGRVEQSVAPVTVGSSPSGGDYFSGYLQSIAVRNYGVSAEVLRGTALAVSDGAESWWIEGSEGIVRRLEGMGPAQERIAVPFTSDGYRAVGVADSPREDSLLLLLRHARGSAARPPLLVKLGKTRKIEKVYGLYEADGTNPVTDVRGFTADEKAVYLTTGERLIRMSLDGADPAAGLASSDWLDRYLTYLQSDWPPSGNMPDWEDIAPGAPPLRRWDYVRLSAGADYPLEKDSRIVDFSRGDRGNLFAWALSRHSTGTPEVRAYEVPSGEVALRRTPRHYLLPGSFSRDLEVTVVREREKEVLYSIHRGQEGDFEIHRLEPWAKQDVRRIHRGMSRVGDLRYDPSAGRLWVISAPDEPRPFLYSLKSQ